MQYLFFQNHYPRITDRIGLERMLTDWNPLDDTHRVPWHTLFALNGIVDMPVQVELRFLWGRQNPHNGHTTKRFAIVDPLSGDVLEDLTVWSRIP